MSIRNDDPYRRAMDFVNVVIALIAFAIGFFGSQGNSGRGTCLKRAD